MIASSSRTVVCGPSLNVRLGLAVAFVDADLGPWMLVCDEQRFVMLEIQDFLVFLVETPLLTLTPCLDLFPF